MEKLGREYIKEEVISLISTIEDETIFKAMYQNRIKGTTGEEKARKVIEALQECATEGIDIEAHIVSLVRFEKTTS